MRAPHAAANATTFGLNALGQLGRLLRRQRARAKVALVFAVGSTAFLGVSKPSEAEGAVVFAEQLALSTALGRDMAAKDMVRQLQIDIPGLAVIEGTSTSLGPKFTGFNDHYLTDLSNGGYTFTADDIAPGNPDKKYNINISVGPSRTEKTWTSRVESIERFVDRDFIIAKMVDAKLGARLPTFADPKIDTAYTFSAFDKDAVFYNPTQYNDSTANGWMMGTIGVNSNDVGLASSALTSAPIIRGGGLNFSSSTPGYEGNLLNPTGNEPLVMMIQTFTANIDVGRAANGAIPFTTSGLADIINDRTYAINSVYVPEPAFGVVAVGLLGGLLRRRRRGDEKAKGVSAVAVALAAVTLAAQPGTASAALMLAPGTTLPGTAYIDKGYAEGVQNFGLVEVNGIVRGTTTVSQFSGFLTDATHVFTVNPETHSAQPIDIVSVSRRNGITGALETIDVSHVDVHPRAAIDAGVLTLAGSMAAPAFQPGSTPGFLSEINMYGYGKYILENGVEQPQDGNPRGWQMSMGKLSTQFDPTVYSNAFVFNSYALSGGAWSGDSGGVVASDGVIVGWIKAAVLTPTDGTRVEFGRFTPEVEAWRLSVVPEPAFGVAAVGLLGGLLRRRRRGGATGGAAVAVLAAGMIVAAGLTPTHASASVVFSADAQASADLGRDYALQDKVRQLEVLFPGTGRGRLDGSATPLSSMYTGIAYHDIKPLVDANIPFTINIATGVELTSRTQTIAISRWEKVPGIDYAILEHSAPVVGAVNPVFGTVGLFDEVTFAGRGFSGVFGSTNVELTGLPHAWRMSVISNIDPQEFTLSNDVDSLTGPYQIPGGGLNLDSGSPGYNFQNQLSVSVDSALTDMMNGIAIDGAIPYVESGLADYILSHTPLNVPEPAFGVVAVGLLGGLLRRRRRGGGKAKGVAAVAVALAAVTIAAGSGTAGASILLKSGTVAPGITPAGGSYLQFGEQVGGGNLVWIEGHVIATGEAVTFNGILTDASTVLTFNLSTHSSLGAFAVDRLGTGPNINTNPGQVRTAVTLIGSNATFDASILRIDGTALSGITPLVFASSPPEGGVVDFASYSPTTISGAMFDDKNVRGGQAKVSSAYPGFDPVVYTTLFVGTTSMNQLPFPAVEDIGGSGGLARSDASLGGSVNSFVGQVLASNGPNGGTATLIRENTPAFVAYYNSVVPEPTSLGVFGGAFLMLRRRRAHTAR